MPVVPGIGCKLSILQDMSSFHDQIFSEIDAARKLAAEFANRHGRAPAKTPRMPGGLERLAQEEAAAAEIAALAAEEERLASQARERAEHRAKTRAEQLAKTGKNMVPEKAESRWNAMAILKGLAKLRVKERSAAEQLIRKAHEELRGATDSNPGTSEVGPDQPAAPIRGMWSPSLGASQIWYFTSKGTRCGPVTFAELRTMAASRVLDPRLDMVWKEGMAGWKQAGLLDGLFERRTVPAEPPETRGGKKFRKLTALPRDLTAVLATKQLSWPGVGRLPLWLGLLLIPLLWNQLLLWSKPALIATFGSVLMPKLLPYSIIVPVAVLIFLVLMRLVNVGMSRWWALMLAIPIVNLWVAYRCLFCPSGYAHHRRQDRPGMIVALAVLVTVPALGYLHLKHPDLMSPEKLQTAFHRLFERAGNMISPK